MFGKKSNVTNQIKLKEELLKEVNDLLYKLEKGKINKALSKESTQSVFREIRRTYEKLSNSIGTGEEDLTLGVKKVRDDLKKFYDASQGNLDGRFEDCGLLLIDDMEEIVDLENGMISEISSDVDNPSKKQKTFYRKLQTIENFKQEFVKNRNRVEDEIAKIERDKQEYDARLLKESNPRLKQNIFRQIKATINKVEILRLKSSEYSSCNNLLDSIMVYAKELVEIGHLSSDELDKAKFILRMDRIRFVLDDPSKLKSLLKVIEIDLKKVQAKLITRGNKQIWLLVLIKNPMMKWTNIKINLLKNNMKRKKFPVMFLI